MKQNQNPEPNKTEASAQKPRTASAKKGGIAAPRQRSNTTVYTSTSAPDFRKAVKKETEATASPVPEKKAPAKQATAQKKATPSKKATAPKKLRNTHHVTSTSPTDEALDEALDELVATDTPLAESFSTEPAEAPELSETAPRGAFQRSRARKEKRAEQKMTELEHIRKKSGFSEDDIDMMLELGYESELGRVVGYENLKKLKQDHAERFGHPGNKHYRTAFGYCGEETVNDDNRSAIIAKYMHDRKLLIIRTLLTALATILLFLLDYSPLIGGAFATFDAANPLLFPILSLLLLAGSVALSFRQLNAGLRSFLKITPTPYSVVAIALPVVLIYDILSLFSPAPLLRINALISGMLVLIALCDILRILCEMRVFRIISAVGEKTVLEPTQPRKKKLRQGKKLVKILNDDIDEAFYRVQKAEQISGFFRRFNSMKSVASPLRYFLGIIPAAAFLIAFTVSLITNSFSLALTAFASVVCIAFPSTAVFSFFYPICRANRLLTHYNCALIGDEAVAEYAESKTVIFNDSDLYEAEKCTELSLKESDELRRDIKLTSILFRKIGGALDRIGRPPLLPDSDPVVAFVRIADYGLEAVVDNRYHMIVGSADYLRKSGIRVPEESADRALRRTENVGVMYVAIDGILKLNYEIEYSIKPSFETLIADLAEIDTAIAIQSYDPNLNEAFLQVSRDERAVPIRVIKPGRFESDGVLRESDTGAVALGNMTDIVYPLHAAKRVEDAKALGIRLQAIFSACGTLIVILLCLLSQLTHLSPILIAAYHIVCVSASLIVTRVRINKRTLRLQKTN
ncbi:MAG: hypothetical protein IJX80_01580 [Clostridia bacterium]|nr:hypothetical protein [Clostridia bacterium]